MLTRIAHLVQRWPRAILAGSLLVMVLCGAVGATVTGHLKTGGFITPGVESARADAFLHQNFPGANPNLILLVSTDDGADSAAAKAAGTRVTDRLTSWPGVDGVQSYWTARPDLAQALKSKDRRSALILVSLAGEDSQSQQLAGTITDAVAGTDDNGVTVRAGGLTALFSDLQDQAIKDLAIAEAIAAPLTLLALILVFGSLVAAAMPAAIGVFSVITTMGVLRLFTTFTDVSVFALNLTTALGFALAIDYSLFIVSRYREELENGRETSAALVRTVQTAGRTVLFSALTVAISLAGLLAFEQYVLRSVAYAGIAVILGAAFASIVLLPAALWLLGDRINALDLRKLLRLRFTARPTGFFERPARSRKRPQSRWFRWTHGVMKRAVLVAVAGVAVLIALGSPFVAVAFGYPDDRSLPTSAPSRQVGDALRAEFNANMASSTVIALPGYTGATANIGTYAAALSKVPGVPAVVSSDGVYTGGNRLRTDPPPGMSTAAGTYLTVATTLDPYSPDGAQQLDTLRAVPAPSPALFGGAAALNEDSLKSITGRLPYAGAVVAVTTLILLFLFTGSVFLPVKALLLNTLSLSVSFGAMVWIFQQGHLSNWLGFTATGTLNPAIPILMFCLAFGMSMDYEVFLLSRVREEWLKSKDNTHSIAMGVAGTGRIFTAAAGLMVIIFAGVSFSRVSHVQLFGVGMAIAVIVDATIVRALLAPALMRMMGARNWWAPAPLAALHKRIGLEETPSEPPRQKETDSILLG